MMQRSKIVNFKVSLISGFVFCRVKNVHVVVPAREDYEMRIETDKSEPSVIIEKSL